MLLLLPLLALWGPEGVGAQRYTLRVLKSVTVQEGLCVFVPCEFSSEEDWTSADPARGYWFRTKPKKLVATYNPKNHMRVQMENEGRFHLLGDPKGNNCSLDIRDARKEDEGSYFFRVERGKIRYSYISDQLSVHVTALNQTPRILIPETLESGRPNNLTCSVPWACERGTPPIFSWTGAAVLPLDPTITHSSVLALTPRPQDHGTNLTCQVTLPGANVTSKMTVDLSMSCPPQNLTVTISQGPGPASTPLRNGSSVSVPEGQSLRLLCRVHSCRPGKLTWSWGNLSLCPSQPANPGLLEVTPEHLQSGGEFTCRAHNTLGSQHISLRLSLASKARPQASGPTGVAPAAAGACTTALLFLAGYLVLVTVRRCRKKLARPAESARNPRSSASQGPLIESQTDTASPYQPLPAVADPSLEEGEEIHYAALIFHEERPRDLQRQRAITTEYSEIKIHK